MRITEDFFVRMTKLEKRVDELERVVAELRALLKKKEEKDASTPSG
jgi:hypothetical protein